jgi:hypothetical protein
MPISVYNGEDGFSLILLLDFMQKVSHTEFSAFTLPENFYALTQSFQFSRLKFLGDFIASILPEVPYSSLPGFLRVGKQFSNIIVICRNI